MQRTWVGLWMMVSLICTVVPVLAADGGACSIGRGDLSFQIPLAVLHGEETTSVPAQTSGGIDYWFQWGAGGAALLLRTVSSQVTVWTAQTGAWASILDANDCPQPTPPTRESVPQPPADSADSANACAAGGTMAGKCSVIDPGFICPPEVSDCQAYSEMLWQGGWYLIRFEQGLFSRDQIPGAFQWLLPLPAADTDAAGTCTVDIGSSNAAKLGLADSMVVVPLAVINGQSDPDANYGATPYGFDWRAIDSPFTAKQLMVYGFQAAYDIWDSYYGWWAARGDCPTPTPPAGL